MDKQEAGEAKVKRPCKWRKRLVIAAVVVCVLLAAWLGCYWWARAKLGTELEVIRAAGEPTTWVEMAPPAVADADNAALVLNEAMAAYEADVQPFVETLDNELEREGWKYPSVFHLSAHSPEFGKARADQIAEILVKAAPSLTLVRKTRGMTGCNWGLDYGDPFGIDLLSMSGCRQLARALAFAADLAQDRGDCGEAIAYVRDIWGIGEAISSEPILMNHLAAMAIESLAVGRLEDLACDLRVGDGPGQASREQIEQFMKLLLDDQRHHDRLVRCAMGERAHNIATIEFIRQGKLPHGATPPVFYERLFMKALLPLYIREQARLVNQGTALVKAAKQNSPPEAKKQLAAADAGAPLLPILGIIDLRASYEQMMKLSYRYVAMRRMAGVALAIRLYEIDNGSRPAKLADLVPKYLKSIPADPFVAGGKRLVSYLPSGKRPLLYCVGENEIDEGGKYSNDPEEDVSWEDFDLPFFLNGDRPREPIVPPAATTQPATAPGRHSRR